MSIRIVFRLGNIIPDTEALEIGEPIFDPERNRLGMGSGNNQPAWYPSIDPRNQDLVLLGDSQIRSDAGGESARFGFDDENRFVLTTFSGLRIRVTDESTSFFSKTIFNAGGTLSGEFNTDGGTFTDMNVQEITVSALTKKTVIRDGETGEQIGHIDAYGVTSKAQRDFYAVMAAQAESQAQLWRNAYGSGLVAVRQFNGRPFDPMYKQSLNNFSAIGIHDHGDWRAVCGLGELSVLVNGYHITTRHNDYRLMRPTTEGGFGERDLNTGVPVPSVIVELPKGYNGLSLRGDLTGTQVDAMRNIYTRYPEECVFELSYLECWIERFDGSIKDIASSGLPVTTGYSFTQAFETYMTYMRSGFKPSDENLPLLPGIIVFSNEETGHPEMGYLNWRISSSPVGTLSNVGQSKILDGHGYDLRALPFNPEKAADGVVDATNRFRLRRNLSQRWFQKQGRLGRINHQTDPDLDVRDYNTPNEWINIVNNDTGAMFDVEDLETLCSLCPGFDGVGDYEYQFFNFPRLPFVSQAVADTRYSATSPRGLGYYSNSYSKSGKDASGADESLRGFNDPNLFTALTRHPQVLGGVTFMLPLELILRTPRENWNPFNVPYLAEPAGTGTRANPYTGWNDYGTFNTIPVDALEVVEKEGTQADTQRRAWMVTPSGSKEMLCSGITTYDHTGERRRFPVIPDAMQFSSVGQNLGWLKHSLKQLLKRVASGNITAEEIDDAF